MLLLSKTLHSRPILSLRTGTTISTAVEPIISPFNLKIIGWWCQESPRATKMVLLTDGVREHIDRGLVVDDETALSLAKDLVRHQDILRTQFQLLQKPVRTETLKLGKVSDYCYDEGYFVQKLYVDQPLYKALAHDTRIIGRSQIIEVTDHDIVVQDTDVSAIEKANKRGFRRLTGTPAPSAASSTTQEPV